MRAKFSFTFDKKKRYTKKDQKRNFAKKSQCIKFCQIFKSKKNTGIGQIQK